MDKLCPSAGAGVVTTFYAYDGGPARSLVLASMAASQCGGGPVLMIDWDLESPGLHHLYGSTGERPGLLEFFGACRDQLAILDRGPTADDDALARQVLAAVDWRAFIEPVDADRPLYLLRAGRVDASWGERAAQCDWHALFQACPALLRQWRAQMAQAFHHVLIDARGGRSAAVSVCTSLLPDRLVGLFTPARRSLDGLCGVVQRAIAYRCSHEEEQRPLLLYPVPCAPAGAGDASLAAWRRGDAGCARHAVPGYQAVLEQLMQASYSRTHVSLESYFDHVQLPHLDPGFGTGAAVRHVDHDGAGPGLRALLDWVGEGDLPWQSHPQPVLRRSPGASGPPRESGERRRQRDDGGLRHGHAQFPALRALAGHDVRQAGPSSALRPAMAVAPLSAHGCIATTTIAPHYRRNENTG